MALTTAQQSAVFKLAVGLFNAAPGGFYNEVAGLVVGTLSPSAAADALINTNAFQAIIPSNLLTNQQFADKFVENLVGSYATAANKAWASAQIVAQLNGGASTGAAAYWAIDALSQVPTNDANWGAAAAALNNKMAVAQYFTVTAPNGSHDLAALQGLLIDVTNDAGSVAVAEANATSTSINLTTSVETTLGTAGNDLFKAFLANGANTLQSGDTIRGGAGTDTLMADVNDLGGENAIAFTSQAVEKVMLRAQHAGTTNNGGDNNLGSAKVAIDAERAAGVNTWEDNNSRADLIIEDVRIQPNQITKDITIVMRETDPGNVDYGVYFDQNSLRNVSSSTSQINLQVMDTRSVDSGTAPLLNSPYGGFRFTSTNTATGVATVVTLQSQAIDDAQTYAQLRDAFQAAADAQFGAGVVNVAIGSNFTVTDTTTGHAVTGSEIVLSTSGAFTFTTPAGSGWIANGVVPANSGLHTNFSTGGSTSTALVTSTIILDDVGRGSTGGDLVVGGLSVGDTSTSKGVQRFEITVEDNSKLQHISSTNNTLREVSIVNGTTTRLQDAYTTTVQNAGNLTVNGHIASSTDTALPGTLVDQNRDGDTTDAGENQHGAYGFSDVRLIDGSAMTGKLEFTAEITDAAIAKYVNLVDPANNPAADNVAVTYSGGANNDTMTVDVDAAAVASRSTIHAGREDFTFTFNGNAGNDSINVSMDRIANDLIPAGATARLGNAEAWYTNQKLNANFAVNGGDGNDTIRTPGAGDKIIDAGAGDDVVYSDNTGAAGAAGVVLAATANGLTIATPRAVWVLNTANQSDVGGGYVLAANEERSLADLKSSSNTMHALYKATTTVTYKGLTATANIDSTNYMTSDLQINQAIKSAINGDAVLSKLLVAQDGPANTLVVTSLHDGLAVGTDLAIGVTAADATTFTTTDVAALAAAWAAADAGSNVIVAPNGLPNVAVAAATDADTAAEINALFATEVAAFTGTSGDDYMAQLAETGAGAATANTETTGADSITTTDNTITGGTGNDVIVLSTTGDATADAAFLSRFDASQLPFSNEVIKYTAAFGNDVIVNFKADTDAGAGEFSAGYDVLDFTGIGGNLNTTGATFTNTAGVVGVGAVSNANGSIMIDDLVTGGGGNDSVTAIKALFTDDATAGTMVYVTVNSANVGSVYQVVDGTAASGDLTVTLLGTIDLADTAWSTLTAGNF